ncbi:hypothetical protein HMPREF1573_01311 [Gardnerella vaginalis JCP7276]|nr:hypothetical protein HMPREF1573_01311 [Gardnerella vaginalis JCP7276]
MFAPHFPIIFTNASKRIRYRLQILILIIFNKQLLKLRNLIFLNNQQAITMRNQIMQGTFYNFYTDLLPKT